LREVGVTPHVAQKASETATTRHQGYALSQKKRKRMNGLPKPIRCPQPADNASRQAPTTGNHSE
jgi:hypothetical protein